MSSFYLNVKVTEVIIRSKNIEEKNTQPMIETVLQVRICLMVFIKYMT